MFFNLQVHIIIPTNRAITIKAKTYKQKLYTHIKHKREAFLQRYAKRTFAQSAVRAENTHIFSEQIQEYMNIIKLKIQHTEV